MQDHARTAVVELPRVVVNAPASASCPHLCILPNYPFLLTSALLTVLTFATGMRAACLRACTATSPWPSSLRKATLWTGSRSQARWRRCSRCVCMFARV